MRALLLAAVTVTTAACASVPTGPSVLVLPGTGKSTEQFLAEDGRCRQVAAAELERVKGGMVSDQKRYDMAYMQCMYTQGNQIPVSGRAGYGAPAPPADVPTPPSGPPPPPPPPPR